MTKLQRQPFAVLAARVSKEAVRMSHRELEFFYAKAQLLTREGLEDDFLHSISHIFGTWT